MESYIIYDVSGQILMVGSGYEGIASEQEGLLAGASVMLGTARLFGDYVDTSGAEPVVALRPLVAHGWTAGPAPLTLDMAGLPSGTLVTATNEAGDSVDNSDPADPNITLADAETYQVIINPPFPHLPESFELEVT